MAGREKYFRGSKVALIILRYVNNLFNEEVGLRLEYIPAEQREKQGFKNFLRG